MIIYIHFHPLEYCFQLPYNPDRYSQVSSPPPRSGGSLIPLANSTDRTACGCLTSTVVLSSTTTPTLLHTLPVVCSTVEGSK
jgi:hypothetical protein